MKTDFWLGLILLAEMVLGMTFGGLFDTYREWYYLVLFMVSMLSLITTTILLSIKWTKDEEKKKE